MAFQLPSAQQELKNRKILEELQQRKKQEKQLLLRQVSQPEQATTTSTTTGTVTASLPPMPAINNVESQVLTVNQRAALQHAHAHSVGYFITQDSSFGNLILPVMPRLENK